LVGLSELLEHHNLSHLGKARDSETAARQVSYKKYKQNKTASQTYNLDLLRFKDGRPRDGGDEESSYRPRDSQALQELSDFVFVIDELTTND
jgi:hypothetical protein